MVSFLGALVFSYSGLWGQDISFAKYCLHSVLEILIVLWWRARCIIAVGDKVQLGGAELAEDHD